MSLFFTSDTHFGHTNLTRAGKTPEKARPFNTTEEHDEMLVRRWNAVVGPKDTVYHLGDVCWTRGGRKDKFSILGRLNGKIHLILGNHDQDIRPEDAGMMGRFESIDKLVTIKHQGHKLILCHYPLAEWDSSFHGSYHLHGHCHGHLPDDPDRLRMDVGVDCWNWTPIAAEAVLHHMEVKAEDRERRLHPTVPCRACDGTGSPQKRERQGLCAGALSCPRCQGTCVDPEGRA